MWSEILYEQKERSAVGSPLLHVIATIFKEAFEAEANSVSELKPIYWYRCVDSTHIEG